MGLRIAVRDQREFVAALRAQAARFEGDVEVVPLGFAECEAAAMGETVGFDLVLACTDWIASACERGSLYGLTEWLRGGPPDDWPEGWHGAMHKLNGFGDGVFGVPYHDGPQVLHYRADIFEDVGVRGRFGERFGRELVPPRDWGEFVEVAGFLTDRERGVWGCCFGGYPDGHNNVYDFLLHLWSRGGEFFDTAGVPAFAGPTGIEALTYYAGLVHEMRCAPPECLGLNSVESGDFYAQGGAAMMWNWSGYAAVAENPAVSKIVGCNRTTGMPGGVSINAYWVLSVLEGSTRKEEAYQFIRFAATAEMDRLATDLGVNGVRLSTWRSAEVQAANPVYRIMAEVHDGSRCLPQRADYLVVNGILSRAVDDALNLRESPEVALARAAEQIGGLG